MTHNPEEINGDAVQIDGLGNAYSAFEAAHLIQAEAEGAVETTARIYQLEEKAEGYRARVQPDWGFRHDIPGIYARNPVLAMGNLGVSLANGYYGWRARHTERKAELLSKKLYEE